MHNVNEWLQFTGFDNAVTLLEKRGFSLDYVSDKMLEQLQVIGNGLATSGAAPAYRALVVPFCKLMPAATLQKIIQLARDGATVIFQGLPADVPGLAGISERRQQFRELLSKLPFLLQRSSGTQRIPFGKGQIFLSPDIEPALRMARIYREDLTDMGLQFIRRALHDGKYYYIVNHSAATVDTWMPVRYAAQTVTIMDPQTGRTGMAGITKKNDLTEVHIQIKSGEAIILKTSAKKEAGDSWKYAEAAETPVVLNGEWHLHFKEGGPHLPADRQLPILQPWTAFVNDSATQSFSGTAVYSTTFHLDSKNAKDYLLQLGSVYESARVFINGREVGILWSIPYETRIGQFLRPGQNTISIEVANLMANRIRNMDRNKQEWRKYHEINFVNILYKNFNAANWEVQPSGLQGPVTITALR